MTVLRVCYKQGARFNERYYFDTHIPMAGAMAAVLAVAAIAALVPALRIVRLNPLKALRS